MQNIKITENKLIFSNGDFQTVDGVELVKQEIIIALHTFYNDWLLDSNKGIDYSGGFRNLTFLEDDIKKQILGVKNVLSIDRFELSFNKEDLTVNVFASVMTDFGDFEFSEILNYVF